MAAVALLASPWTPDSENDDHHGMIFNGLIMLLARAGFDPVAMAGEGDAAQGVEKPPALAVEENAITACGDLPTTPPGDRKDGMPILVTITDVHAQDRKDHDA